jgi:hypothetical protein
MRATQIGKSDSVRRAVGNRNSAQRDRARIVRADLQMNSGKKAALMAADLMGSYYPAKSRPLMRLDESSVIVATTLPRAKRSRYL